MRRNAYLNGQWDFMPDFTERRPEEAIVGCVWENEKILVPSSWKWKLGNESDYEPLDVFNYPDHWDKADSGVLGRTFEANPIGDERVFLIFKGVFQNWQVYINDVKVFESQEAFLPVEIDITDYTQLGGNNSLKVWCGPFKTIDTLTGKKQVGLTGSWFAQTSRGIWQDVMLEYRNTTYLLDPVVRTSYREKSLEAEICVVGSGSLEVLFSILDGEKVIKTFEGKQRNESQETVAYKAVIDWEDPILWMPDHPHLYILKAELKIGNQIMDTLESKFGFREVWCKGICFYLNGIRVNLRGDSWHYQGFVYQTKTYALNWYKMCKEAGMNFVRLHAMPYPEIFLEAADELGMLIIDESAIYGSSKLIQSDHETFIENCKEHLERLVKRDRNHPSVIMWSMQNEMRWVDGRDGYKLQMKKLIAAMKTLDSTRPISFDGDNRLVEPEDMEVVSMHYNIDGTIASWDKSKPLAFGEHGKWHYVSPQVASGLVGGSAYEDINSCLINMSMEEAHFSEYARKEEVTVLSAFNIVYYMMKPMPVEDQLLTWESDEGPGVKPRVIRKYSMTIHNGLLKDAPIYTPNASYQPFVRAFKPVSIIAEEYNHHFYEEMEITRSFNVYNDSYEMGQVHFKYELKNGSNEIIREGSDSFFQLPGEQKSISLVFKLPKVKMLEKGYPYELFKLELELYHWDQAVDKLRIEYKVYPQKINYQAAKSQEILYIGEAQDYALMQHFIGGQLQEGKVNAEILKGMDLVILGRNYQYGMKEAQALLEEYVASGGFLLIMEQEKEAPGEVVLSGRKEQNALMVDADHPIFKGLTDDEFTFWSANNTNVPGGYRPVINAFEKPIGGDLKVLLECGDGDFGWGGLLWAAMLEYRVGKGRVLLQQLDLTAQFSELPQVKLLLNNVFNYAMALKDENKYCKTGIFAGENQAVYDFFDQVGVNYETIHSSKMFSQFDLVLVDAARLHIESPDNRVVSNLKAFVQKGGQLIVLPIDANHAKYVGDMIGSEIILQEIDSYQFKAVKHPLTAGIAAFDTYHYESVTYTPANKTNSIIAEQAIALEGLKPLFITLQTPWEDLYVKHFAGESIMQATIQIAEEREYVELCFGGVFKLDEGEIVFSQIIMDLDNDKLIRVYSRLLANMGAEIKTNLLTYIKEEKDFGIGSFMALRYEAHEDFLAEEVYFSNENYVLNNLGEGVYGWMKRVEKKDGYITIEESAGKTYFLTLFLHSDLNRNPLKRADGELPDSSIVPDLILSINCEAKIFVNGKKVFDRLTIKKLEEFKIEDIMLNQGLNRLTMIVFGGAEDISFNCCFINKYGDFINDLKYTLTMD